LTKIYSDVFKDCTKLTSISLPPSIENIGDFAFNNTGLRNFNVDNITTSFIGIDEESVSSCPSLKSINISGAVTIYSNGGNGPFYNCPNVTDVTLDSSNSNSKLTDYGFETDPTKNSITTLTINEASTSICNNFAFDGTYGFSKIKTVNIGSKVTSIGANAFQRSLITSISIPSSVTDILTQAFYESNLDTVEINSNPSILNNPFLGCDIQTVSIYGETDLFKYGFNTISLKTVTINDVSTAICDKFAYNNSITVYNQIKTLNIGSKVTSIGNSAFKLCTGLTSVVIPSSVTSIEIDAFKGCSNITSLIINSPIVLINDAVFADCTKLTNVEISGIATNAPGTVAFYDATGIKNLSLNGSTPLIEFRFNPSLSLTNLTVTGTTGYTTVATGFTSGYKTNSVDLLTIEDGVITVAPAAFQGCTGIKNLKIMPTIATIGAYAFAGCTGITSIDFDPPVDLTIADHAFEGNTSLTTLLLPEYIISIGDYSFANCTNLTTITIQNPNMFIGANAFAGCTSLKTVNYCGPYTFGPSVTVICSSAPIPTPIPVNPVCFVKGTRILTIDGYIPIEKLKLNASLISKGRIVNGNFRADPNGCVVKKLKGIGNFKVDGNKKKNAPICIKKNAFFHNYPSRDLYVSADHGIIVGTKNVQAKDLVNDDTIYRCSEFGEVEYFHVELDHHSAIIAENMPTESYLDVGNRNIFENWISVRQTQKIGNIHSLRR
jgi:hypothetical protein